MLIFNFSFLALCALTAASLTQDKFGVVQRDIPRIIEALCQFLSVIEDYQKELNDMYAKKSPSSDEDAQKMSEREKEEVRKLGEEVARAGEVLGEVGDGEFSRFHLSTLSSFTFFRIN